MRVVKICESAWIGTGTGEVSSAAASTSVSSDKVAGYLYKHS